MHVFYLVMGTVLSVLLLIKSIQGAKYADMLEALDDDEFPLKGLYCIGLSWTELPIFALKGKIRENLVAQAKLLYDSRYCEYYANVVWAQCVSFVHLALAAGFALAGIFNHILMLIIGVVIAVFFGYYFLNHMSDVLNTRATECTAELPEIVSTMALLINAGMMLRQAWETIATTKEGTVYKMMRDACYDMENGMSEIDAIHKFGRLTNSQEIRKFTSTLAQSFERGGGDLSDFLSKQSNEMWTLKKQLMLQKGEAAASKLLAPTAMLFVAIIIAVMSGALGMLI